MILIDVTKLVLF